MNECLFSCVTDGLCVPECNAVDNWCDLDFDCLELEGETILNYRDLRKFTSQVKRGFLICFWTALITGFLCLLCCAAAMMFVEKRKTATVTQKEIDRVAVEIQEEITRLDEEEAKQA